MAVPLLLALLGTGLNEISRVEQEQALIEAQNKQEKLDNEALQRQREDARKRERQEAMSRYLRPTVTPAGVGEFEYRPKVIEPKLSSSQLLGGLGQLAQQLGTYYAAKPSTNTGGQSYYPVSKIGGYL